MLDSDRVRFGKGFYSYSDFTATPGKVAGAGATGFEVSDMLIGTTSFTATGLPGTEVFKTRSWENSLFVQDDWQASGRLTLNLGLRYDVFTPPVEANNRLANFDPATNRIILPNENGAPRATVNTDWNNFGPRAGFAYQINHRTVVRAAYGLFYAVQRAGIDNELTQSAPFGNVQFRFSGPGSNVRLSQPIPLPATVDPNSPTLPDGAYVIYQPRDSKTPQVQQYSVSVQREVGSRTSLMAAYVGTRGKNLLAQVTSAGFSGDVSTRVTSLKNVATSQYDGVQLQARQTAWQGLTYLVSYTFSKATNDSPGPFPGSNVAAVTPTDTRNLGLDQGRADYDRPHYFSAAISYELPWLRGGDTRAAAWLGGWQVNGILTFASGVPFSAYSGNFRAKLVGDPSGPGTIDQWFNTAAFVAATSASESSGRNILRAPGISTVDFSLFKNFRFTGTRGLEFRLEVFNLFDKAQFGIPGYYVGNADFGQITSTVGNTERQMQIGFRYAF